MKQMIASLIFASIAIISINAMEKGSMEGPFHLGPIYSGSYMPVNRQSGTPTYEWYFPLLDASGKQTSFRVPNTSASMGKFPVLQYDENDHLILLGALENGIIRKPNMEELRDAAFYGYDVSRFAKNA